MTTTSRKRKTNKAEAPKAKRASPLTRIPIETLQAELTRRERGAERLLRKRNKLQSRMDQLDREIDRNGFGSSGPRRGDARVLNKKPLKEVLIEILGKAKEPLSIPDLAAATLKSGYRSNSGAFQKVVGQMILKNTDAFSRVERGTYKLKQ